MLELDIDETKMKRKIDGTEINSDFVGA